MNKYKWIPTTCAHECYPVKLMGGAFDFNTDEPPVFIPRGNVCNNGWGEIGLINLTETEFFPLPSQFDLNWFADLPDCQNIKDGTAAMNDALPKARDMDSQIALKLHITIGWAIKGNVFKQFCGGETIGECARATSDRYRRRCVRAKG